jgi:triphosphoribosyl-dephospho-CoA synthetase
MAAQPHLLEASAAKPGNVSPGRSFADLHYEDFLAGAAAIGAPRAADLAAAGRDDPRSDRCHGTLDPLEH